MYVKHASNDDNNPIGQRLRLEMKKRGFSSVELAKRADVKTSFIYDIISGKSANPSSVRLARVAECLGISLTYLAGSSNAINDGYQFAVLSASQDYTSIMHLSVEEGTIVAQEIADSPYHFHKEWLKKHVKAAPENLRLFTIHGDNMTPTLHNGDFIMVDIRQTHPSPSGIYVLFDGVALVAKRLEYIAHAKQPTIRIISDNAHYSTHECLLAEAKIVGRAVWFSRLS